MLMILANVASLAAFVCCILIGIKGIQAKDTLMGVLSILCWIVALVMAFTKQREWGISSNLRLALIVTIVAAVVLSVMAGVTATPVTV